MKLTKDYHDPTWIGVRRLLVSASVFLLFGATGCRGQEEMGTGLLHLDKSIRLPAVRGRIDHIDVDPVGRIAYIAALGNNSLEIVDLNQGKWIHRIPGLDEPQGVAYIARENEILVANGGSGECDFFSSKDYHKIASVKLSGDADDVRYDSTSGKIYVGYGSGGIAELDAATHRLVADVHLPGHPESFQLDKATQRLFVNVPDARQIAVIDLSTFRVLAHWTTGDSRRNFPMALDTRRSQVLIGYRSPARLEIRDESGRVLYGAPMVSDADDLYFDGVRDRIYVSGGGGYINVFGQSDSGSYRKLANIRTRSGARTSLFVSGWQQLLVAARSAAGQDAELMIFSVQPEGEAAKQD